MLSLSEFYLPHISSFSDLFLPALKGIFTSTSPMYLKLNMPGLNSFLLLHLLPLMFPFQLMEQSQDKNLGITIDFSLSFMASWSPRLAYYLLDVSNPSAHSCSYHYFILWSPFNQLVGLYFSLMTSSTFQKFFRASLLIREYPNHNALHVSPHPACLSLI